MQARRRAHLGRLIATATALLTVAPIQVGAASAQASGVTVAVRTAPRLPAPGDAVAVTANVTGCSTGPITVEIYLSTAEASVASSGLMAEAPALQNLLGQHKAHLALPNAYEGWYGARARCGAFRPSRRPMPGTLFAVGSRPSRHLAVASTTLTLDGPVVAMITAFTVSGDRCPGASAELDLTQSTLANATFVADLTVPVNADGTFSAAIPLAKAEPGVAVLKARCIAPAPEGAGTVMIAYEPAEGIRLGRTSGSA